MKKLGLLSFVAAVILSFGINVSNDSQQAKPLPKEPVIYMSEHGTGW
ncbi:MULTISPECIES: hypothetical protein [Bacillus cereus group]|nr:MULTISPECIES: hypothetical protein [Bacillus cereus group]MED2902809.1 hypothetical protein [Bacillus tropicus]MED3466094.1 hypothetical protein [Bacillus thuringiensis]